MTLWKLRHVTELGASDSGPTTPSDLPSASAPTLSRIVETSVYVSDLPAAREFYAGVLGLEVMLSTSRLLALRVGGLSVLLLFQRTAAPAVLPRRSVVTPGSHGGTQQLSFAIPLESITTWIARLQRAGIVIEQRTSSPSGSESLCVRDPDGHAVELVTPGLWSHA